MAFLYGEAGSNDSGDASFLTWADIFCFIYLMKSVYDMVCELALYGFNAYFNCIWNITDLCLVIGVSLQLFYRFSMTWWSHAR